ncbi:MAG: tetratricopeptide repeat protein [Candidatus Wallbacteria bacterium]|nr:tetratricopeptide repeat protein [Candidatus Wallbacteria bacterium]
MKFLLLWMILIVSCPVPAGSENPFQLIMEARRLFSSGEFNQALPLLNRALILDPGISYTYYYLGKCYEELKDRESSMKYYRLYLQLFPSPPETAIPHVIDSSLVRERAWSINDNRAKADEIYRQAKLLLEQGSFAQAARHLEEAVSLKPDDFRYCKLLARICRDLQDYKNSLSWYRKALYISSDDPEFLLEFFRFSSSFGSLEDTLEAGKKILAVFPDHQEVRELISKLTAAADSDSGMRCPVWKRAGSMVIIEHSFPDISLHLSLIGKEIPVYRGSVQLQNPLTGEFIDFTPEKSPGLIRIVELRRKVLQAVIVSETDYIGVGDFVMLDR